MTKSLQRKIDLTFNSFNSAIDKHDTTAAIVHGRKLISLIEQMQSDIATHNARIKHQQLSALDTAIKSFPEADHIMTSTNGTELIATFSAPINAHITFTSRGYTPSAILYANNTTIVHFS